MPRTWRQCPNCREWRPDVRRTWYGAREQCGDCSTPEFGSRRSWADRRADDARARWFHEQTRELLENQLAAVGLDGS